MKKSTRLQQLRGTYGIKAPAPICPAPPAPGDPTDGQDPATCQVVQAPAGGGLRLVPDGQEPRQSAIPPRNHDDAEIRLTYRELSALIEDAIRSLR